MTVDMQTCLKLSNAVYGGIKAEYILENFRI